MRIERIHVESFGRLTGFDTGSQALGPLAQCFDVSLDGRR